MSCWTITRLPKGVLGWALQPRVCSRSGSMAAVGISMCQFSSPSSQSVVLSPESSKILILRLSSILSLKFKIQSSHSSSRLHLTLTSPEEMRIVEKCHNLRKTSRSHQSDMKKGNLDITKYVDELWSFQHDSTFHPMKRVILQRKTTRKLAVRFERADERIVEQI